MPKCSFKFHYEKKPDEDVVWKDSDNIYEPFKEYSKRIKENKDELIFYYKGISFKYKDCEINETLMNDLFNKTSLNSNINIMVFPLKKTKKKLSQSKNKLKLSSSNTSQKLTSTELVPINNTINIINEINPIKIETENKKIKTNEKKELEKEYYNDILCPQCFTTPIIENDDLKLNIINCDNFHRISNIEYDRFELIDSFPHIKCHLCGELKSNLTPPETQVHLCICGSYICPTCFKSHSEEHHKIEIEEKNYKCIMHDNDYDSYCIDCNKNICESCTGNHSEHEIFSFRYLKPKDNKYIKNIIKEVEEQKKILNLFVENSKKLFDNILDEIEKYINKYIIIEKTLLNRYKKNTINFQLLQNIRNKKLFYENPIFNILQGFNNFDDINDKDISKKLDLLNNLYKKINSIKKDKKSTQDIPKINSKNEMTIKYKIIEKGINKSVKLFDSIFVDNNVDNLILTIEGKEQKKLEEYYNNATSKDEIIVKIVEKKPVTNMSYMFNNCKCLNAINIKNWDTTNITNMESLFQLCSFEEAPDISRWNTINVTNMRAMFSKFINLKKIPEMQKWNTFNVKDMSFLFNGCISIETIPKFPGWNTQNVEDMSYMFSRCIKLKELHNLGKLNTTKVKNMCGLFNRCEKLIQLPDISRWNMSNVNDISIIFQFCSKIEKIPDIYKWQLNNIKDMSGVFSECNELKMLPRIGNWNPASVENMCGLFNECNSLTELPDMSKWNTSKCTDMSGIFCGCSKITQLPNLSGWDTSSVSDISNMFEGCSELKDISSTSYWNMGKVEEKENVFNGCSKLAQKDIDAFMAKIK